MRLGVIDVGSNTVHLLAVDAYVGAHTQPTSSHKIELRLAEHVEADGSIDRSGADALVAFTHVCLAIVEDQGADDLLALATSAIREAPMGRQFWRGCARRPGSSCRCCPAKKSQS